MQILTAGSWDMGPCQGVRVRAGRATVLGCRPPLPGPGSNSSLSDGSGLGARWPGPYRGNTAIPRLGLTPMPASDGINTRTQGWHTANWWG